MGRGVQSRTVQRLLNQVADEVLHGGLVVESEVPEAILRQIQFLLEELP